MYKNNISRPFVVHHIKIGLYTLAAVILAGWIRNALSEDIMFRMTTRHLLSDAVAAYAQPPDSAAALLVWGVPLLAVFLLMLTAMLMTMRHIRKRHMYVVHTPRRSSRMESIAASGEAARRFKARPIRGICRSPPPCGGTPLRRPAYAKTGKGLCGIDAQTLAASIAPSGKRR